jgi:NADH-quinone oxidoreductase subunit H
VTVSAAPPWSVLVGALMVLLGAGAAAALDGVCDPVAARAPLAPRLGRPVFETARLMRQRRRATVAPDLLLWRSGTASPLVVALLMSVVVPWGSSVVADLTVGLVWFNAMDVLLWAAFWLAGWGPNSVHGLVGGYRFLAQALAYELPLMFALTAPAVAAASLRLGDIVASQQHGWFVLQMPVAAIVFLGSVAGFSLWGPFGYPDGADIAGGVLAETAGVDRLLLVAGRYALLAVGSAMAVALFLGGGNGPFLPGWAWSLLKSALVLALLVAWRRRLPVWRADRAMRAAWLFVLPLTLLQVLATSVLAVVRG